MDDVVISIAGKALSGTVTLVAKTVWRLARRHSRDLSAQVLADLVDRSAVDHTVESLARLTAPDTNGDTVQRFLGSAEFQNLLMHLIVAHLVDDAATTLDAVRARSGQSLSLWFSPEDIPAVFTVVDASIATTTSSAIRGRFKLSEAELRFIEQYAQRLLLAAIHSELAKANVTSADAAAIDDTEAHMRSAIARDTSTIAPPSLTGNERIPLDTLYVAPHLSSWDQFMGAVTQHRPRRSIVPAAGQGSEPGDVTIRELRTEITHAVIAGDPGGGKSSLVSKLASDAIQDEQNRYLPIVVVLKEYGHSGRLQRESILDFIAATIRTTYGCSIEQRQLSTLLLTGRVLLIFDGFDELLDTTMRAEVRNRIELLSVQYPNTRVFVTSRRVGYPEAPLDPAIFTHLTIAPFDEARVKEYATKWFRFSHGVALHPDANSIIKAYMRESSEVADLRSNPLMLSLLCNLYQDEGYLPANRPDVYEKCSGLLFEKWDRRRNIVVELPLRSEIRPAMSHLALKLFTGELSSLGVERRTLVTCLTEYLGRYFDRVSQAREAAESFVDFFTGRAWVFTDVGSHPESGEALYAFTHRTFLEYFSAGELANSYTTPEALLEVLRPRVERAEWDVVAQLALQMVARSHRGTGDTMLLDLASSAIAVAPISTHDGLHGRDLRFNVLNFVCRVLSSVLVSASTLRELTRLSTEFIVSELPDVTPNDRASERPRAMFAAAEILMLLVHSAHDRSIVFDELSARLGVSIGDGSVSSALFVLSDWKADESHYSNGFGTGDEISDLDQCFRELALSCKDAIARTARASWRVSVEAWAHGLISIKTMVVAYGLAPLFRYRRIVGSTHHGMVWWSPYSFIIASGDVTDTLPPERLPEILEFLTAQPRPWLIASEVQSADGPSVSSVGSLELPESKPSDNVAREAALVMTLVLFELVIEFPSGGARAPKARRTIRASELRESLGSEPDPGGLRQLYNSALGRRYLDDARRPLERLTRGSSQVDALLEEWSTRQTNLVRGSAVRSGA